MQRDGHSIIPHGTLQSYDPQTGTFTAFMDFQAAGDPPYTFTPHPSAVRDTYEDSNGLLWELIR